MTTRPAMRKRALSPEPEACGQFEYVLLPDVTIKEETVETEVLSNTIEPKVVTVDPLLKKKKRKTQREPVNNRTFFCGQCRKSYFNKAFYYAHFIKVDSYECKLCSHSCGFRALRTHMSKAHNCSTHLPSCHRCKEMFLTIGEKLVHVKDCNQCFFKKTAFLSHCALCPKRFYSKNLLKQHIKRNHGIIFENRKIDCNIDILKKQIFYNELKLKLEKNSSYQFIVYCKTCSKDIKYDKYFTTHYEQCYLNPNFVCPFCTVCQFKTREDIDVHFKSHLTLNNKISTCDECNVAFFNCINLYNHIKYVHCSRPHTNHFINSDKKSDNAIRETTYKYSSSLPHSDLLNKHALKSPLIVNIYNTIPCASNAISRSSELVQELSADNIKQEIMDSDDMQYLQNPEIPTEISISIKKNPEEEESQLVWKPEKVFLDGCVQIKEKPEEEESQLVWKPEKVFLDGCVQYEFCEDGNDDAHGCDDNDDEAEFPIQIVPIEPIASEARPSSNETLSSVCNNSSQSCVTSETKNSSTVCKFCSLSYDSFPKLCAHVKTIHNNNKQMPVCLTCGKFFLTTEESVKHSKCCNDYFKRYHINNLKCGIERCKRRFPNESSVKDHMLEWHFGMEKKGATGICRPQEHLYAESNLQRDTDCEVHVYCCVCETDVRFYPYFRFQHYKQCYKNPNFVCPFCNLDKITMKETIDLHLEEDFSKSSAKKTKCKKCNLTFLNNVNYFQHGEKCHHFKIKTKKSVPSEKVVKIGGKEFGIDVRDDKIVLTPAIDKKSKGALTLTSMASTSSATALETGTHEVRVVINIKDKLTPQPSVEPGTRVIQIQKNTKPVAEIPTEKTKKIAKQLHEVVTQMKPGVRLFEIKTKPDFKMKNSTNIKLVNQQEKTARQINSCRTVDIRKKGATPETRWFRPSNSKVAVRDDKIVLTPAIDKKSKGALTLTSMASTSSATALETGTHEVRVVINIKDKLTPQPSVEPGTRVVQIQKNTKPVAEIPTEKTKKIAKQLHEVVTQMKPGVRLFEIKTKPDFKMKSSTNIKLVNQQEKTARQINSCRTVDIRKKGATPETRWFRPSNSKIAVPQPLQNITTKSVTTIQNNQKAIQDTIEEIIVDFDNTPRRSEPKETFFCSKCEDNIPISELAIHSKLHLYKCPFCTQIIETANTMKTHLLIRGRIKTDIYEFLADKEIYEKHRASYLTVPFDLKRKLIYTGNPEKFVAENRCSVCKKIFEYHCKLLRHQVTLKHDLNIIQCGTCKEKFSSKYMFDNHLAMHAVEDVHCQICQINLPGIDSFLKHLEVMHSKENLNSLQCRYCFVIKLNDTKLKKHVDKHHENKYYKCNLCEKYYQTEEILDDHKFDRHTAYKYKCEGCLAYFSTIQFKIQHMATCSKFI